MMDNSDAKPQVLALRRFLLSSSSSSSSASSAPSSQAGGNAVAADAIGHKKKQQRVAMNTSSISTDFSTSSATSVRNYSHQSTPLQTNLQRTMEKVGPVVRSPDVVAGEAQPQQRRSQSSDSVESHDYVDALASSAFRDCRSATRTLYSVQQALSFTGTADPTIVAMEGADKEPSSLEDLPVERDEEAAQEQDRRGGDKAVKLQTPFMAKGSGSSFADTSEVGIGAAAAMLYSPSAVTKGEKKLGDGAEMAAEVSTTETPGEQQQQPKTPPSVHLALPLPHSQTLPDEEPSHDTTSSSRHQVGVWKAIYGKETWTGSRRSCSRGDPASEDATASNTEELDPALILSAAVPGASAENTVLAAESRVSFERENSSSTLPRRTGASQWASTRKTALELLRAQLNISPGHVASAAQQQVERSARAVLPSPLASYSVDSEEVLSVDGATVAARGEAQAEENDEDEGPFEIVEVHATQPASSHIVTDVAPTECAVTSSAAVETGIEESQQTTSGGLAASTLRQRRTAEDVLEQLFSGVSLAASSHDSTQPQDSEGGSGGVHDSNVTSALQVTGFSAASNRLVYRPTFSADVSGISPIKTEAPSILADLYDTPEALRSRPAGVTAAASAARAGGTVLTPPSSPVEKVHRKGSLQPQQIPEGTVSEGREEYTLDLCATDFRTAQTLPTSSPSSVMSASPAQSDILYEVTSSPQVEASERVYNEGHPRRCSSHEDQEENVTVMDTTAQSNLPTASALRTDSKVTVFPATVPNAWDVVRVSKWRSKAQQSTTGNDLPSPSSPHHNVSDNSTNTTIATPATALRQERVRQEMRAKEMAECTFHPTLSPGTRAMVRRAQEHEIEVSLVDTSTLPPAAAILPGCGNTRAGGKGVQRSIAAARAKATAPALDPRTLKATLQNVYERLYPVELSVAASRRQILDQEMEFRRLAREELILLRRRACVVVRRVSRSRTRAGGGSGSSSGAAAATTACAFDTFDTFMSAVLQTDWDSASSGRSASAHKAMRVPAGATASSVRTTNHFVSVVDTSYMSPMAVALLKEREMKRKTRTRREAEMQLSRSHGAVDGSSSGIAVTSAEAGETVPAEAAAAETFRVALFDEFLLRQNAYYFHRARSVRELERKLTPAFTPTTTPKSARLVQAMVSRSLLSESMGPETSSLIAQRQRQRIPLPSSSLVTQHQSPYRDPCTFTPQLSPAARAAKVAERSRRVSSPSAKAPSVYRKEFFERLYGDHERMRKERAKAKEAAAEEEMVGVTFKPQLNGVRNAQTKSVLDPKNYGQYQQYLHKKRASLDEQRQAQLAKSEAAEEVVCTFRPQTTKTPSYISKMSKSFGVLRQQDTEF
jgi:hypothetical protein